NRVAGDRPCGCNSSATGTSPRSLTRRAAGVSLPVLADRASGEDRSHDVAADVGQAEIAAGVAEGQPLVVEAECVQDRRLQIVHVHAVFDDMEAQVVGLAV